MGGEPIEFFAHVGLGRDQDRFLVQPVGVEALRLREQRRHLLGKPGADRFRPPARHPFGALRQRCDLAQPRRQHLAERGALVAAHRGERADGFGEAGGHHRFGITPLLLALLRFRDLHHALERKQAVERRRRRLDARCQLPRRGHAPHPIPPC